MAAPSTGTLGYLLERWIQRGLLSQLLLMAAVILAVAVLGGLAAWLGSEAFDGPGAAIWWAFLRLTDPGYLGDDEGLLLRVISTVVTVLGYVLFMGSLIAIMTQWLATTLRRLESGLTPIALRNHIVVLGWTNRTAEIVAELLSARGRLRRFLAQRRAAHLRVVVLAADAGPVLRHELRAHLGAAWRERQIVLRTGSSLQPTHLERLALEHAAAVIVPGADFGLGGAELNDTRCVKTLLTVDRLLRRAEAGERPDLVAEVFEPSAAASASGAVSSGLEVVAGGLVISRLISQSVLHRGVARILTSILSHRDGDSLFVRELPELEGRDPRATPELFSRAVCLGVVRGAGRERHTLLDPREPIVVQAGDQLVFLAECWDDCAPTAGVEPGPAPARVESVPPPPLDGGARRILVLGWSHRLPQLLRELSESHGGTLEVTVVSRLPVRDREPQLVDVLRADDGLTCVHVEANHAHEQTLLALDPGRHDHVILLASGGVDSSEEADARTVMSHVLLEPLLRAADDPPDVIVELLDPDNSHLFDDPRETVLVTPRIISLMLAHVALRSELNAVFDALFCARGPEFSLRSARDLDLAGRPLRFADVQRAALARGELAVGLVDADDEHPGIVINPDREREFTLGPRARLVVLAVDEA